MWRFHGTIELNLIQAKKQFSDLADEVVIRFAQCPDVKISMEIHAESSTGFDKGLQKAVEENKGSHTFKSAEFDKG